MTLDQPRHPRLPHPAHHSRHARPVMTEPPADGFHAEAEPAPEGAMPVDPAAAAMLPAELLQPDEIIILMLKPSPWFILLGSLKSLTIIALLGALAWLIVNNTEALRYDQADVLMTTMAVAAARLFWQFLEWLSRVYVLTDRRVIRVAGVIRIQVFDAPLKSIQHITIHFSMRERLWGLGTLGFATAGSAFTEAYWRMIPRPMEIHQQVVNAINRYR